MKTPSPQKKVRNAIAPPLNNVQEPEPPQVVMTAMIEELVRERAYQLYQQRGGQDGHAESDWFQAEQEVLRELTKAAA